MSLHHISSDTKLSGTKSDFTHSINLGYEEDMISLVSISFPKSYYLINDGKNTFLLDAVEHTVPEGNYDVDSFFGAVNSLITPSSVTFSTVTGKVTLTSSASNLIFPSSSKLYKLFGFEAGSTNAISGTVTSTNICNFQALQQVFICSNISNETAGDFADILSNFYINEPDFSNIQFYNTQIMETGKKITIRPSKGHGRYVVPVRFTFKNEDGEILDLNGEGVSMVLKSWKSENINEVIRAYIDFRIADSNLKNEISKK